jgi:hypothetical protein
MLAKGSYGSANRVLRRHDVLIGDRSGITDKNALRAGRSAIADAKSTPAKIVKIREADCRKAGFWPSVVDLLMEGLALCAVSLHPTALFLMETDPDEQRIPQPDEVSPRERRGPTSPAPRIAGQGAVSLEVAYKTNQAALARDAIAVTDEGSHELERDIEKAVAALAKLDDRTLWDLGIPHRSHIERTVRYCHDC